MAGKLGLGLLETLLENLDRDLNLADTTLTNPVLQGTVTQGSATALTIGVKKFQTFAGSLADIGDGSTAFDSNDVLVELGALDLTVPSGAVAASKIIIDRAIINVTTAAGQTLDANLALSATSGTAANAAADTPTEIFGADASMSAPDGSGATTGYTEADIDLNATGITYASPNIEVASTLVNLYVRTHTALAADAQAGRFTVHLEYTVL